MSTSVVRGYTATAYPSTAKRSGALRIQLSWDANDPYAVALTFPTRPVSGRPWVFSRELLEQGLSGLAGIGDVRCMCSPGDVYVITLIGSGREDGISIDLRLSHLWVTDFLAATTLAPGSEPYGDALDSALTQLLDEAA
jgi:hypothetical protein